MLFFGDDYDFGLNVSSIDYFREIDADNQPLDVVFVSTRPDNDLVFLPQPDRFIGLTESDGRTFDGTSASLPLNPLSAGVFTLTFSENQSIQGPYADQLGREAALRDGNPEIFTFSADTPATTEVITLPAVYLTQIVPGPGDMVGRVKFGENNSPIPRDRVIFDYSLFDGVSLGDRSFQAHRYAPGIERTFANGNASIDVRVPFATTLDSDIVTAVDDPNLVGAQGISLTNTSAIELGDLSVTAKFLMHHTQRSSLSWGVQTTLPTADDVQVFLNTSNGREELIRIENESYHLMPFIAGQFQHTDRFFSQLFVQGDFDVTGSPVYHQDEKLSTERDTPFLYVDYSLGYWLYQDTPIIKRRSSRGILHTYTDTSPMKLTGIAPRFELHYNRSLDSLDGLPAGEHMIGEGLNNFDNLNMTLGATFAFGADKDITFAWGRPLTGGSDADFDDEFRLFFNLYTGPRGNTTGPRSL
ncbi:MAG: hypothetical protein AB8G99_14635 [Planctomycetaceae bacterium]